ncbi:MAG: MFS transporter [Actinomycetota bacterium]|jgi:MFS family permease|nr:MFS transporter [Actinomycetota bacterium]
MEFPQSTLVYTSIICFLAWVVAVYDFTLFGTLLPRMADEFGWSPATSTAIATYVAAGTFVFALMIGPLLDYIGRKKALMVAVLAAGLSSALTALTPGAIYLTIVRAFSGLGWSEEVVNTTYLNEIYGTRRRRGFMYAFVQGGWPIGALLGAATSALLLGVIGWRGVYLFATIPAVVIAILALKLRESPVYEVVKRVRKLEREGRHAEAMEFGQRHGLDVHHTEESTFRQIFEPDIRKHTILLSLAWLLNFFGIQAFSVLGTTVLVEGKGVSFGSALTILIVSNVAAYIGYLSHGFVGDYLSRRLTIAGGWMIGGTVFTIMLFGPDAEAFVLTMYALGLFFLNGPYAALLFYMGESFPARTRGTGVAFAHAMGPIGTIVGSALITGILSAGLPMTVAAFIGGSLGMFLSGLCMLGCREVHNDPQAAEILEDEAGARA